MVPGVYAVATATLIVVRGSLETTTTMPEHSIVLYRSYSNVEREREDRELRELVASLSGLKGSRRAWHESPRVDPSVDDELHLPLPSQLEGRGAERRTFGGPRGRTPIRSRPGANALAA